MSNTRTRCPDGRCGVVVERSSNLPWDTDYAVKVRFPDGSAAWFKESDVEESTETPYRD